MPAARDLKTSEVPDRRPAGAVVVGGMMCPSWRRRPKAASSPSSGDDAVYGWLGEGSKFVNQQAWDDLGKRRDNNLEWLPRRQHSCSLGGGEGAAKVLGVMEKDNLLFVVCREEEISAVIFSSAEDSKFITPVKPGLLQSPDSFTVVIERK